MQRTYIQSKKIRSWAYDAPTKVMEVEYIWGSIIRYFEVQPGLIDQFQQAESRGSFLSKYIEFRHPRRKLMDGEDQSNPLALPPDQAPARPTLATESQVNHDMTKRRRQVKLL